MDGLSTGGQMPRVDAKNMSFEKALRIFRKKCDNAGIKEECRDRKYLALQLGHIPDLIRHLYRGEAKLK